MSAFLTVLYLGGAFAYPGKLLDSILWPAVLGAALAQWAFRQTGGKY